METVDFSRSFATFVTPERTNNARIQIEAICETADGETHVLVASCKSEDTYASENLFRQPNYDFCAIFGEEDYCIVRVGMPLTACWRDSGRVAERFDEVLIERAVVDAEFCEDPRAIVEATLGNRPLVGRTEILDEAGETLARLHYPIKTMNVNEPEHSPSGDWIYQVDTGPIIAPEPRRQADLAVERLDLAFIAWNATDRAELVVLAPTPVNHSDDCVGHYSQVRTINARNAVLALR
ncbi:MAG: hypothetical protein ACLFU7_06845 [Armatimonadota bacterium]